MKIVATEQVAFAKGSRSGSSAELVSNLRKMSPGQSLIIDVDVSEVQGRNLEEWVKENEVEIRRGETTPIAVSRVLASRQRTRIMATLAKADLPHYFHTRLCAPDGDGLYVQVAVLCAEAANRPARKARTTKKKAANKAAAAAK